jgi:hypothetical protein
MRAVHEELVSRALDAHRVVATMEARILVAKTIRQQIREELQLTAF